MSSREVNMFARHVFIHLKPNNVAEFARTLDQEIIPVLRKLRGFQDEIAFVVPGGTEALGISLWDRKEDADAFNRREYPRVLKVLARMVEGHPQVQTYEVSNSTFHALAARAAA
jgi:hypothetical protein